MTDTLPFPVYDADNHFYEPEDAILRHLPAKWRDQIQFVTVDGRKKLAIGGRISQYIPNPTFERVAAPGAHLDFYRARNREGRSLREIQGKAIAPPDEFRRGEKRLAVMDRHGVHAALFFPTLFSAIENRMAYDHGLLHDALHALNLWTSEEWGFARHGRMFGVPIISLADMDRALAELDWLLAQGARCVCIRPAPVPGYRGSRSMGLPEFDPFWARIAEARIFVAIHAADTNYDTLITMWTGGAEWLPFEPNPLVNCLRIIDRAIADTVAALICGGVFDRHPDVRIACIENGAAWVRPLIETLRYVHGQMPQAFGRDPVEAFHRHIFVAPFVEDDVGELARHMDISRILFGSDWPHPEGTAEPLDYVEELAGFDMAQKRQIMSSNLQGLLEGRRD
ncbi:amidohydrolase family protein [Sphingomonas sp. C8-2]|jgi:predicted TIM-barrel fold metal-dependent hydrolase|uniref:Amidohydrolase n=1 Tax=Rhizorhabdus histidinilytica TaxID=439228 RepID=A0A1T5G1K2_9SPHN|nr:amidohydrolase family protein [Rhizorhabdus histidinilytica]QEH81521.1 amidohydrolase family protein [Sphingomonas sp. C8-2]SKC02343.1 Amidohydrolase [Rhizorhabdus histidinilytica]